MDRADRDASVTQAILDLKYESQQVNTVGTAQNVALNWLLESDDFYLCASSDNLAQRYAAAVVAVGLKEKSRLSSMHECDWSFFKCSRDRQIVELRTGKI